MRISDWSSDVCSSDLSILLPIIITHHGTTMRQPIHTDKAPAAIGPYSQAVRCGDTVYMSGQIPIDTATGELVAGDIAAQARRAFDNLGAVCEAAGGSLDDVARVGLYLTNLVQLAEVNAVMEIGRAHV